jgi:hypothetical protein
LWALGTLIRPAYRFRFGFHSYKLVGWLGTANRAFPINGNALAFGTLFSSQGANEASGQRKTPGTTSPAPIRLPVLDRLPQGVIFAFQLSRGDELPYGLPF